MTAIELARRVKATRDAQRRYFRERTIEALDEARRLEWELDETLAEIIEDRPALLPMGDDS